MNKKFVASAVLVAIMFIAIYGGVTPEVEADRDDSSDFVKRLSDKFNLDEDEVSSFMQEVRADRFATMSEHFRDNLLFSVEQGQLTEAQMEELLDMHGMHIAEVDSYNSLTVDERQEMMTDHRYAMKIWADENGVDFDAIHMGRHH